MELDRLDYKLMTAIQGNNRLTSEALGELIGLSATACQRRLKRLRDAGVIEADVAIVSPAAVGRPLLMIVHVLLERERADMIDRFKASIKNTPEIMAGYYTTGEADFVLMVSSSSMEEYEEFTRDFFYDNRDVKAFKTMVVMDRVKATFALPLQLDQPVGGEKRKVNANRSAVIEASRAGRSAR